MHSSRMHNVHRSSRLLGVSAQDGSAQGDVWHEGCLPRGYLPEGVYVSQHALRHTPPCGQKS